VRISRAFDAASTFKIAMRSTVIDTVGVCGTKSYTSVGEGIAVRLARNFTTVKTTTFLTSGTRCTRITTTIGPTVGSSAGAIGIHLARSTDTSISIASRLSRSLTSIKDSTVSVRSTSLASLVGLAVGSASLLFAVRVILTVGNTLVRVYANSVGANGVLSHREGAVVHNAIRVVGTSSTTTILVAVLARRTVIVTTTSGCTFARGRIADFVSVDITAPGVVGIAIGISSAVGRAR